MPPGISRASPPNPYGGRPVPRVSTNTGLPGSPRPPSAPATPGTASTGRGPFGVWKPAFSSMPRSSTRSETSMSRKTFGGPPRAAARGPSPRRQSRPPPGTSVPPLRPAGRPPSPSLRLPGHQRSVPTRPSGPWVGAMKSNPTNHHLMVALTLQLPKTAVLISTPMNASTTVHRPTGFRAVVSLGILLFSSTVAPLAGQSVAPARSPEPNSRSTVTPTPGEVVALSAFEVQADRDNSYGALNSNSITRFNVEMDRMPVSADIFTETFMRDVGSSSVEDVIRDYAAGAGYADGSNNGAATAVDNQPGDRVGNAYIQIRGMMTPTMQRDGFMPVGSFSNPGSTAVGRTDNFDVERVEVINGPQALLYGGGGAGGVINVTSKQARFGRDGGRFFAVPKGSVLLRIDDFGTRRGELDFGLGNRRFAVRVALLHSEEKTRRDIIGSETDGQYVQFAFRAFTATVPTTVRFSGSFTRNDRWLSRSVRLTAPDDPRNNMYLTYLLETGRAGASDPATGAAYPRGAVLGGQLTWDNVDSLVSGTMQQEPTTNAFGSVTADTKWSDWLTTQVAGGYNDYTGRRGNPGTSFFAPRSGANTSDEWAAGLTPQDSWQPSRSKGGRFAALITKDFFGGRAKTQTLLGVDYISQIHSQIGYRWYQADANWNILTAPGTTVTSANSGRTILNQVLWPVSGGPVFRPLPDFDLAADRGTIAGVNYVRALQNPPQASLATPANPLGTPTSGNYIQTKLLNRGFYGVNYTQWFDGK
ncbi:MAG: hypothetical protein FJ399_14550, partial [Verrucomicrobia bacterium]|nr:hypothetical protein [Verrucomicrobiota bacterium]